MVEDYVPDRLEFNLASTAKTISRTSPAQITIDGRYLYGAPAAKLELDGEVVVKPASERPNYPRFQFGLGDEEVEVSRQPLENLPETDAAGKARFSLTLDKQPVTTRPLEAQVTVRMNEPGGRAVERKLVLPVMPATAMIGVKPLFSGRSLGEGDTAAFEVVVAAPDGAPVARSGLRYELLKVETRYQYYRRDGAWQFEPVKTTRRVSNGQFDVAADRPARLSVPLQWGRYRLEVSTADRNGPVTSVAFDAGWYAEASADTPDLLEVALDKPEYAPGDSMTVAVTARTAGKVTLNVVADRLITTITQDVQPGIAQLRVPVGSDWGSGAYLVATLRRPLDTQAQRMPGRAIGVQWFSINRKARTLALNLGLPSVIRPNSALRVPVKVEGLAPGEEARIVVAAVDVGILNLTNYKPPAPDEYYLGQRRLTTDLRDLYGQLIDGMQGTRGQIRTGGDTLGVELQGSPPTQKPLALHSGVVTVGPDGTADIVFDVPDFAGTIRVMAVAWSKDKVGRGVGDLIVRDPVVLTATLPRFLLTGDRASMHLDLDNVEGSAGDYTVAVQSEGLNVVGGVASQTVRLNARQRSAVTVPLTAAGSGTANVTVRISGPGGFAIERNYALAVKPATQILARRTVKPLPVGESLTLSNDLFADLVPGTGRVSLSVGLSTALDAAALLAALDRYPFGCSEQIASRALPLLYVNDLASAAHLAFDTAVDQRVRESIDRVLARQGSNGSFGLWSAGGDDVWLDAYVTDFLTRAREKGFAVPMLRSSSRSIGCATSSATRKTRPRTAGAISPMRSTCWRAMERRRSAICATRRHQARRLRDADRQGAARRGAGDARRSHARRTYLCRRACRDQSAGAGRRPQDYGSVLRDAAALVTLASEGGAPSATVTAAVQRVETARGRTAFTSTQENAWMVLAARALAKDAQNVALDVNGEQRKACSIATCGLPSSRSRSRSPTWAPADCRPWSRCRARRPSRSPRPSAASRSSGTTSRSTASRSMRAARSRTSASSWC